MALDFFKLRMVRSLGEWIHFQGGNCKLFCLPSEKGSILKGKNLLPFRLDPFSEKETKKYFLI